MSFFGDHDDDDTFDATVPPDPLQVARRLWEYRRAYGDAGPLWDTLPEPRRAVNVAVMGDLLRWLARSGHLRHG